MNIGERIKAPVPPFFKKVRKAGLALMAAGGVLMSPPFVIPDFYFSLGGYLLVVGTVLVAVSQATVTEADKKK